MTALVEALQTMVSAPVLLGLLAGFAVGVFVGAIPGIGPELGMLLLLPFTLAFDPAVAMVFLVAVYAGGDYGGSIPAILINTPGTAGNAATILDGYPMAQRGKAITALSLSAVSGAFGSIVGGALLLAFVPILGRLVLAFGTPEYFMMAVLGLCTIAVASSGGVRKGLIVAVIGALLSTVGANAIIADRRFTFDLPELANGLALMPAFVGLFAIAEMAKLARRGDVQVTDAVGALGGSRAEGLGLARRHWFQAVKSTLIGVWVGIMPGQGGSLANYLAYMEAKTSAREPQGFGKGHPAGLVAPESSNNAIVPGTLVPTLSFGIPGSASAAILLGALLLHGLRPGPDMFSTRLSLTYVLFLSVLLCGFVIFAFGVGLAPLLGRVPNIPNGILVPTVGSLALVGAFAVERNFFHVWQALLFGAVSLALGRFGYPVVPFVLGFILGPIAELNLMRSLLLSGGDPTIFLTRPFSAILAVLAVLVLVVPPLRKRQRARRESAVAVKADA